VSYAFPSPSGSTPEPDPGAPAPQQGPLMAGPQAPAQPSALRRLVRLVLAGLLGVLVAGVGTFMFQSVAPIGLIVGLAATTSGALTARAWVGYPTFVTYVIGWALAAQLFASTGPGGSVIVPAHHAASYIWLYGGFALVILVGFAPRSWFAAQPRVRGNVAPAPTGPSAPTAPSGSSTASDTEVPGLHP
jgi:hypothetical protein